MSRATVSLFDVSDAYSIVIPTGRCNTYWSLYSTRCMYFFFLLRAYLCDTQVSQAFKGVAADLDALIDLLETVEHFLKRLNIYTKVPPTPAMTEMIVKIMAELLSTLALATKQINQGRPSEFVYACSFSNSMG
jgi:hypothetical protein